MTVPAAAAPDYHVVGADVVTQYQFAGRNVAMRTSTSGPVLWRTLDAQGTPMAAYNASGTLVSWWIADAWGAPVSTAGNFGTTTYTGGIHFPTGGSNGPLVTLGARDHDPRRAAFSSPDPIIPDPYNPAALNRYSYTYTDPSGHCAFDGDKVTRWDCSTAEFDALSAADRIKWLDALDREMGVDSKVSWFNNVRGIIAAFSISQTFGQLRPGTWASVADAGTLEAIQDGWAAHKGYINGSGSGRAGSLWGVFFGAQQSDAARESELLTLWGAAEQAGVDYGRAKASGILTARPAEAVMQLILNETSDLYRAAVGDPAHSLRSAPYASAFLDPRTLWWGNVHPVFHYMVALEAAVLAPVPPVWRPVANGIPFP